MRNYSKATNAKAANKINEPYSIGIAKIFDWKAPKPQITCNDVMKKV